MDWREQGGKGTHKDPLTSLLWNPLSLPSALSSPSICYLISREEPNRNWGTNAWGTHLLQLEFRGEDQGNPTPDLWPPEVGRACSDQSSRAPRVTRCRRRVFPPTRARAAPPDPELARRSSSREQRRKGAVRRVGGRRRLVCVCGCSWRMESRVHVRSVGATDWQVR